ncbi:hypothetical protein F4823DRAFT_559075 [Ustulina deusta]|nr:hypothetical protein F4823DRAFT_559075 [Ustulina deusta]
MSSASTRGANIPETNLGMAVWTCSTVQQSSSSPSLDTSSFNIHLYRGWDPIKHEDFDDMWVYEGVLPRWGYTGHIVGQRQKITIDGTNSTDSPTNCD